MRWPSPLSPGTVNDQSGVSTVVGTVLLLAIVVLLVGVSMTLFLELTEEQTPAPNAVLSIEVTDATAHYELSHEAGETIDGDNVQIRGIADPDTLAGRELTASDTLTVHVQQETVRFVWSENGDSYTLRTFEVDNPGPPPAPSPSFSGGTVFTGISSGLVSVAGDGGSVATVPNTDDVEATGPLETDLTGDGDADVPYVTSGETITVVDAGGDTQEIADSSDIPGSIETSKTRLASGDWNGDGTNSVFFVDQNHDTLHRADHTGTVTDVATPGDGVQAVVGIGDVDDDGSDELVFADASQQLRYLESGGSVTNVDNGQTGSNNGIGAGSLADVDGDGVPAIVGTDGSNDLKINREPSGGGTTILSGVDAAKAPVTVADVDGDGDQEVVYVGLSSNRMKYVDDPLGSPSIEYLHDEHGSEIGGSDETGVV